MRLQNKKMSKSQDPPKKQRKQLKVRAIPAVMGNNDLCCWELNGKYIRRNDMLQYRHFYGRSRSKWNQVCLFFSHLLETYLLYLLYIIV